MSSKAKAKAAAYFKFLISLPSVNIDTFEPTKRDCAICLEPYTNDPWSDCSTKTMNQPVRLACGHVLGIQCLAAWAFSPNFNNGCLYCTIPLITGKHLTQDAASRSINNTLKLRQRFKVPFQSRQENGSFQKLMAKEWGWSAGWMALPESQDRMMVLLEEYSKIEDPSHLAPLTWCELEWWSPERNRFSLWVISLVIGVPIGVLLAWVIFFVLETLLSWIRYVVREYMST